MSAVVVLNHTMHYVSSSMDGGCFCFCLVIRLTEKLKRPVVTPSQTTKPRPFYQNPLRHKIKIPYGKNRIVQEGQKTDFPRLENIFPSKFLKIRINYKKYTLQNE